MIWVANPLNQTKLDAMIAEAAAKAAADSGGSDGGGGDGGGDGDDHNSDGDGMDYDMGGNPGSGGGGPPLPFIPVMPHAPMASNLGIFPQFPHLVAGLSMGGMSVPTTQPPKRPIGKRGVDTRKRQCRRCMRCVNAGRGDAAAVACNGSAPRGVCEHVREEGEDE